MAQHHVRTGESADAIPALREAVAHSYDQGDMTATNGAIHSAVVALAELSCDDAGATCAGALFAGLFARFFVDDRTGAHTRAIAALRDHLGPERYDAAYARGAAADYDEIVAIMLSTFDDLLAELG